MREGEYWHTREKSRILRSTLKYRENPPVDQEIVVMALSARGCRVERRWGQERVVVELLAVLLRQNFYLGDLRNKFRHREPLSRAVDAPIFSVIVLSTRGGCTATTVGLVAMRESSSRTTYKAIDEITKE